MARCSAIKANGERCKVLAAGGSQWCAFHDPARDQARRRAASKGGRSKGSARVQELHERLEELARSVIAGELQTGRGAVAIQAMNAQIRLLDYERKAMELEDLLERLERLENGTRYAS